jgi:alpha-glucoside transport system substrate-binding protein
MTESEGDRVEQFLAQYVAFLEGEAPCPSLSPLDPDQQKEAAEVVRLLEATRGTAGGGGPDLEGDRVARGFSELDALPPAPSVRSRRRCGRRRVQGVSASRANADLRTNRQSRGPFATTISLVIALALSTAAIGASLVRSSNEPALAMVPLSGACAAPRSGDGRHVEVAAVWGGTEQERFAEILDRFARDEGVAVTFANGSLNRDQPDRDFARTLQRRIDQGCPPDVALLPQPGLLLRLEGMEALRPLEGPLENAVSQHYSSAWRELATVDGQLYGVWFKAADKSSIWYDRRAFDRADVSVPNTWAELLNVAHGLADDSGVRPFSMAGGDGWTLTDWFENVFLGIAGSDAYRELGNGQLQWTDPQVKEALARMAEVVRASNWAMGGETSSYERSVDNVFPATSDPKAAMVLAGDYASTRIRDGASGPEPRFFDFPSMTTAVSGKAVPRVVGGDVAVLMSDNRAGADLLRFLAHPDSVEPWVRAGGFLSPNRNIDLRLYPPLTRRLAESLTTAEKLNFDLSDLQPPEFGATPGQGMWAILQDFGADLDVSAAATRLEQERRGVRAGPGS